DGCSDQLTHPAGEVEVDRPAGRSAPFEQVGHRGARHSVTLHQLSRTVDQAVTCRFRHASASSRVNRVARCLLYYTDCSTNLMLPQVTPRWIGVQPRWNPVVTMPW